MKKKFLIYLSIYILTLLITRFFIPKISYEFMKTNNIKYFISFMNQIVLLLFSYALVKSSKINRDSLNKKVNFKFDFKYQFFSFATVIIIFYSFTLLDNGIFKILTGITSRYYTLDPKFIYTPISFIALCLILCVFPAITEECYFRYATKHFFKDMGKLNFILLSGITFGLAHNTYLNIFKGLIIGLVLASIYYRTNSYILVVLIHFCYNFLSFIHTYIIILPWNINNTLNLDLTNVEYISNGFFNISICFFIIVIYLLINLLIISKKESKRID